MAQEVVRKEMLAQGRIVAYRFDSLGTEAAEVWYADMEAMFLTMQDEDHLLMLIDMTRADNALLSAEAMMRGKQVGKIQYHGKTAFLVEAHDNTTMLDMFIDKGLPSTRLREVFISEAEAIAWLLAP
ncbi:MAG: hypothetical protein SGJ24_17015 [Chloroflexota bacterium]|nr:hypothetical protein [Chloroflexota bacterium]